MVPQAEAEAEPGSEDGDDRDRAKHIRSLRIKLQNDYRHPRFIATIPGAGYRFVPTFSNSGWDGAPTTSARAPG